MSWNDDHCFKKLNRCNDYAIVGLYAALTISFIMGWMYIYFYLLITTSTYIISGIVVSSACALWVYGYINCKTRLYIPLLVLLACCGLIHYAGHVFVINDLIAGNVSTEEQFHKTWWTWFLHYNAGPYTPYILAIFHYLVFDLLFYIFYAGHFQTFAENQQPPPSKSLSYIDREMCLSVITI
uniref:Uncharacterized protein n=1 Tax=Panagrolaimus sp. PS1159 TaxID=55785 RepID=A0AC35F2V3_9BILA